MYEHESPLGSVAPAKEETAQAVEEEEPSEAVVSASWLKRQKGEGHG